jgi:oligopeptide/dipeptide ABC transporter ATP-binding protein
MNSSRIPSNATEMNGSPNQAPRLLSVTGLSIGSDSRRGHAELVREATFNVAQGEIVGMVGESGSGKTLTAMSILGLLPNKVCVGAGSIQFQSTELVGASEETLRNLRGGEIGYVAQDAATALNPVMRVGAQIIETIKAHRKIGNREAEGVAVDLLWKMGIADAADRMRAYPHELSGGMRQRVSIGIALACQPKLIIADEPTTALDVTVQSQIVSLLTKRAREKQVSVILITHDLGLIATVADRILVMYSGRIVEQIAVPDLQRCEHPYTRGLLRATPQLRGPKLDLFEAIPGQPPDPWNRPSGCSFHPRCSEQKTRCISDDPGISSPAVQCWFPLSNRPAEEVGWQ